MNSGIEMHPATDPQSGASARPIVALIPGGPGLSGATWADFKLPHWDTAVVHPVGTHGQPEPAQYTFDGVVDAMESSLGGLGRELVVCGHSFGAFYAAELAARRKIPVAGFISVNLAISTESFQATMVGFRMSCPPELLKAEENYQYDPSNATFKQLLTAMAPFYFAPANRDRGAALLSADACAHRAYAEIFAELFVNNPREFFPALAETTIPKLLIAGARDPLIRAKFVSADAESLRAEFVPLADASHFPQVDAPGDLAAAIEKFLARLPGRTTLH